MEAIHEVQYAVAKEDRSNLTDEEDDAVGTTLGQNIDQEHRINTNRIEYKCPPIFILNVIY